MKKTLLITALIVAVFAANAQPTYVRTNLMVAHTNLTAAANTQGSTNYVDATRYGEVGFDLSVQATAATTANFSVAFVRSADGTNYETAPSTYWTVALNGNTVVRAVTNIAVGPLGYVRVMYTTNASGVDATNIYIHGYLKGYRRD